MGMEGLIFVGILVLVLVSAVRAIQIHSALEHLDVIASELEKMNGKVSDEKLMLIIRRLVAKARDISMRHVKESDTLNDSELPPKQRQMLYKSLEDALGVDLSQDALGSTYLYSVNDIFEYIKSIL